MMKVLAALSIVASTFSILGLAQAQEVLNPISLVGAYRMADESCIHRVLLGNSDISPIQLPFIIYPAEANRNNSKGVVLGGYYFKQVFYSENSTEKVDGRGELPSIVTKAFSANDNKMTNCLAGVEMFGVLPIVGKECRSLGLEADGSVIYTEKFLGKSKDTCKLVKMDDQSAMGIAKAFVESRGSDEMAA